MAFTHQYVVPGRDLVPVKNKMSDAQPRLEGLKAGWNLCKAQDDQKHSLIADLFAYIDDLSGKLSETESDLLDKKDAIKVTRDRVEECEKQIQALKLEKARHVFALVVIDGDCMPFKDELVRQGLDGGKRTASLLKQAVEEELKTSVPAAAHHLQVIVRVYANVKGLAKTYKEMEILSDSTSLDEFIRGFNMDEPTCDYVDAGNGKECSDEKVKATFRLGLDDVHCQQILFGGTADNGYARLLGPYLEDETVRGRITLLEGPPFAHELADIKDRFRTVAFGNVFRSQKLFNNKRRVSFHLTPPATPPAPSAVAKPPFVPAPASAAAQQGPTASRVPVSTGVSRNERGQRVDSTLVYSQKDSADLKGRRLCNQFHLLGKCPFLDTYGQCQHEHGKRLSPKQSIALRAVARQSPCSSGLDCSDPDCISGHRCPRGDCVRATCRFPAVMHNVDTKIVG